VFRTLGIRLERGRDFTDADTASAPGVIIVNEAMARGVWGTADVIGRQFQDEQQHTLTIVGVADDARLVDLGAPSEPYVYVPLAQRYTSRVSLLVKSSRGGMIPAARTALRDLNPALPATTAMPLEQVTAVMFVPQRIAAAVAGTLGVFVLLLAAIGIYGVVAYSVGRRTREIGIRMALGADPRAIVRLLLRQGMVMTAIGIGVGLLAGAAAAQVLRSLLFGIPSLDPIAFGGAALLFSIVSVAASYIPARRALGVDPMIALRSE
jgi:predicted lysophospholipase L1 biosynthesis ABC-type transport system permease subunit